MSRLELPRERSLGFQVRRCHRAFDRLLNAHLSEHGLTSGFWYYLRALWSQDGVSQRRLSQMNNVTETTSVTMLNHMTRAGLVSRKRDAVDRRKFRVSLTARGRELEDELMPNAFAINRIAAQGIPKEDIETCLFVLRRMSENLERHFDSRVAGGKSRRRTRAAD